MEKVELNFLLHIFIKCQSKQSVGTPDGKIKLVHCPYSMTGHTAGLTNVIGQI